MCMGSGIFLLARFSSSLDHIAIKTVLSTQMHKRIEQQRNRQELNNCGETEIYVYVVNVVKHINAMSTH